MNQPTFPQKSVYKDIIIISIISILAFFLAGTFDAFELLVKLTHQHEDWEIDELFTLSVILTIALTGFSWRRWRECEHELAYRKTIQVQLKKAKEEAETAKEKAEMANRAKSEFLASMSHELRTPLNGILGYTQILRRDKTLDAKQQDAISTMQKSGEHLLTLINDILDLSKIEAQKMDLHQHPFHLTEFLKNIVDMIQIRAEQKKLDFQCNFAEDLPLAVNSDETRLRQVLVNLLGNAVKFTEQGQIIFQVKRQLATNVEKNQAIKDSDLQLVNLHFQVKDTGTGIAPEHLKIIFEPFQQVGEERYITEGTGLGLPLSQKFVTMMGGTLHAKSTLNEGSTFWFDLQLPEVKTWQPDPKQLSTIIGFQGTPRKILVVDDNVANRMILVSLLSPLGFEIIEAENGQECVEQAKIVSPDMIIMDLIMPIMSGLEATRQIRQIASLQNVNIIAASASAFDKHRDECLGVGCDDFVTKPIKTDEILTKIREHLKLEWIYEIEAQAEESVDLASQPLIGPPVEIAKILHKFAMIGDIDGIMEQVMELKQKDSQFAPFVTQIQRLLDDFETEQIQELVEPYLD